MGERDDDDDQRDRQAILARRNRFVATALAGMASTLIGCGDDDSMPTPAPCLSDSGALRLDAEPVACLSVIADGGLPTPCLDIVPADAGERDAGEPDGG